MQTTFARLLLKHATERPQDAAMREKEYGIWQALTWAELAKMVEHLACGLHAAGLRRNDHMIVVGANRPRLYATMLAVQALGAVPIPLYQDSAALECIFPINNADVRFAFAEDQEQVDKLLEIREQCPQLSKIYFDDPRGLRKYDEPGLASLDQLLENGKALAAQQPGYFESEVNLAKPGDVAAMFFTSGTTGNPKGVVHTHNSLLNAAESGASFDKLTSHEEVLAYLPPAWIGQNIFSYSQWLACGYVVNCPESAATTTIDLKEVGPTYYFAPPRVFEGLLTSVMIRMEDAGAFKRNMFSYFMEVAKKVGPAKTDGASVGLVDSLKYALGNWMVYGPLRNNLGMSRVRVAYTAGEAIGPDLFTFYRSIGINLKQLYGSTETAVFVCQQPDNQARADTVGIPCNGVEIKVADNGEVLVKSPGLFKEYYKNKAATDEVLTEGGWYHTSDAGFLDAHGHLKIIDRVKEVVAYGDGREKVCVMINIDFDAVGNWAERRNLSYAGYTDLAQKPEVYQLIKECVEKVNVDLSSDAMLAGSQVSRFLILHKELDADDGELTRTNKVRRGFIAEKYAALVDGLYAGKAEQYIETVVKFEDGRSGSVSATLKLSDATIYAPVKAAA
jgi:long-chain acyl-CoA synthetase